MPLFTKLTQPKYLKIYILLLIVLGLVTSGVIFYLDYQTGKQADQLASKKYLRSMVDVQNYQGKAGGLYDNNTNKIPQDFITQGIGKTKNFVPLNIKGNPDRKSGKVVFAMIGSTYNSQENEAGMELLGRNMTQIVDKFQTVLIDNQENSLKKLTVSTILWEGFGSQLSEKGLSNLQVRVLALDILDPVFLQSENMTSEQLKDFLIKIIELAQVQYPNLGIIYLHTPLFHGYLDADLEPYTYELAFDIRDLVIGQKLDNGEPLLLWGPYMWVNVDEIRSDGFSLVIGDYVNDGRTFSQSGIEKYQKFFVDYYTDQIQFFGWLDKA